MIHGFLYIICIWISGKKNIHDGIQIQTQSWRIQSKSQEFADSVSKIVRRCRFCVRVFIEVGVNLAPPPNADGRETLDLGRHEHRLYTSACQIHLHIWCLFGRRRGKGSKESPPEHASSCSAGLQPAGWGMAGASWLAMPVHPIFPSRSGVGMKIGGNGQENPSAASLHVFYNGKRERERNSWERKWKRNMQVTETDGNRKIYRNALLFNHHSPCMNITLYTLLRKLFF